MQLPQYLETKIGQQLDLLEAKAKSKQELGKMQHHRDEAIAHILQFCQAVTQRKGHFIKTESVRGTATQYSLYFIKDGIPQKFWIWHYMPRLGAKVNRPPSNLPAWTFESREYSYRDRPADAFKLLAEFLAPLLSLAPEEIIRDLIDERRTI